MSEGGFHVHGPHEHELEHQAHGGDAFAARIAVMTAIFATLGAMFGYRAAHTQNDALLYKNEAAIQQDRGVRPVELLPGEEQQAEPGRARRDARHRRRRRARIRGEAERYKKEKEEIEQGRAQARGTVEGGRGTKSEGSMHVHHRWAQSMTLIQVSIALAAITLLTRNRGLQYLSYAAAAGAVVVAGLALAHV